MSENAEESQQRVNTTREYPQDILGMARWAVQGHWIGVDFGAARKERLVNDIAHVLLAERECQNWQAIETAPKDGTEILLGGIHPNYGWLSKSARYWNRSWWSNGNKVLNPVTHWHPLPSPPKP